MTRNLIVAKIGALATEGGPFDGRSGNAEAILSERLARSEISVEDFRTTLAALRETSSR